MEPDYDPQSLKQSPEITRYIEKVVELIYDLWKNRDSEKAKLKRVHLRMFIFRTETGIFFS